LNARRARAGRGAEGKKARWTGHARPKPKLDGGLAALGAFEYDSQQLRGRPPHAASRPSTFFPSALSPPFEAVARRHETLLPAASSPTSSNDVRRRCCATGDARRAHDRTRVVSGRREPRHGLEREVPPLAFLAFKCRRTVVGHRTGTGDIGVQAARSTLHANGPDPMKHGQVPGCPRRLHSP